MKKPCVFFDRDGIVNARPDPAKRYITRWEEFELLPDFPAVLRVVRDRGYEAVVVTNQKGVATGRMSHADVTDIHDRLLAVLSERGVPLLDVIVCTAADDAHPNRKPNPGMLLEAARKHGLDLSRSWMVGDQERDIEAGRRAGCKTVLVDDRHHETRADFKVETLKELRALLEAQLRL